MPDYGVTAAGFNRKRLDLLLQELNDASRAIFGDNFNVESETADGQINEVVSGSNADLWEVAEECYNAFNPSAATNVSLSNLVQLNNIERQPATSSRTELDLTGVDSTVIPEESRVSTSDTGAVFITESEVVIAGGVATVFASAEDTGPIIALAGTITVIDTPITGWTTANNAVDATEGRNRETDAELRARRARSVASNAIAILDSILASVEDIEGVTATSVLENDTSAVDGNGLPAHSFEVVVVGGDDTEIAQAIYDKKPAGIQASGTTLVQIADTKGVDHPISFTRPTDIPIFVIVNLTVGTDYPADGDDQVAQAIVDYANGVLVEGRGFNLPGTDVIHSRLFTPVNSVIGHEIDSLFIDTSAAPAVTNNISIDYDELSEFTLVNITVNS